jgi:lysozyme family protein
MAFSDALAILLKEEGGFSNDKFDPGGMTNLGVTAKTWAEYTGRPATEAVMRGLTQVAVAPLYKSRYWDKIAGDRLGDALGLMVFDFAVNAGPGRAAKMLQRLIGTADDGLIGSGTLEAVQAYTMRKGIDTLIEAYADARRDYYRALPTFWRFGKGWLARVGRVEDAALGLAE